jgi:trimethylamine--corrinoid protein Co-methyltransferase
VALDEIAQAGPGGNFLTSNQTLRLFRTAYYRSTVLPNMTLEEWQAKDCPRAEEQLRQRTRQLLVEAEAPGDQTELLARGEEWIKGRYRPAH